MDAHHIAAIVNGLFAKHRRPDGKEFTNEEVSAVLDRALHPSTISKTRNAQMTDPRRNTMMLLCKFFGESPVIFFPELDGQEETYVADPVAVALAATTLAPEARQKLAEFIYALQQPAYAGR